MIKFKSMVISKKLRNHVKKPLGEDTIEFSGMKGMVTLNTVMTDMWGELKSGKKYKITIEEE